MTKKRPNYCFFASAEARNSTDFEKCISWCLCCEAFNYLKADDIVLIPVAAQSSIYLIINLFNQSIQ